MALDDKAQETAKKLGVRADWLIRHTGVGFAQRDETVRTLQKGEKIIYDLMQEIRILRLERSDLHKKLEQVGRIVGV